MLLIIQVMILKLNFMTWAKKGHDFEKRAGFQHQEGRNSYDVD